MESFGEYLRPGKFVDSDDADVRAFAERTIAGAGDPLTRAVKLYYAVRDEIFYDPYYLSEEPRTFRASDCLRAGRGFCVPKAALLAAAARVAQIPARVGYADVRNHLSTPKLHERMGTDLFIWHGYTELYLDGRWVKATPAFNVGLCKRFGVHALEFDGRSDSLLHEFDRGGRRHMEYVAQHGSFADVPYETIAAAYKQLYPRWFAQNGKHASKAPDAFQAAAERGQSST